MTGRRLGRLFPLLTLILVACNPNTPGQSASSSPPSSSGVSRAGSGTAAVLRVSGLKKPYGVAVGAGSVWVTEYEQGYLVRIDPATGRVLARVRVGPHASHVLIQDGFAWALDDLGGAIVKVDLVSNRKVLEIALQPAFSLRVALGSNSYSFRPGQQLGQLQRIDTATSALTATIPIDGFAAGVAVGGGAVWVSTILLEPISIFRVDPATNRIVARVDTGHPVSGPLAFGDSVLWVANNDGYLTRIDARSNKVTGNFELGSPEWAAMLAVGKDLWISAPLDNLLAKFDPATGAVASTIRAGARPQEFAFLGTNVWVANYNEGTVAKLPIN
jgi:DNA-binding beta-propeller fold protein YncE